MMLFSAGIWRSPKHTTSPSLPPSAAGEDLAANIEQMVTTVDDTYQVSMLNLMDSGHLMKKGMLSNLSQMPHMDMSKSWWDRAIADDRTIDLAVTFGCGNIFGTLSGMKTSKSTDFASMYASISTTMESSMQEFVENVTGQ